jgi:hypothetical protein
MRSLTLAALSLITLPLALIMAPTSTPARDFVLLSPQAIAEIFCLSRIGNDMAAVEGLLTDDLSFTIGKAEQESDAIAAAHPDEKPPLGDGVPWQAWPDYAATCTPGIVAINGKTATVTLDYGFPEDAGANFTDTLVLAGVADAIMQVDRWRIDDIAYAGGGSLREALKNYFAP